MQIVVRLKHLWRQFTHRDSADHELSEELCAHVDLLTDEKVREGIPTEIARRAALLEVGGVTQVHDAVQQTRTGAPLERFLQDMRYAFRMFRRSPGFAIASIAVLALGIGSSTTVLSVVQGVLLRPFDYDKSEQLVVILDGGRNPVSAGDYFDFKKQNHSFSAVGAAEYWTPSLVAGDHAEKLYSLKLTADVLPLLGVRPALGRVWNADNDAAGNDRVAVISHRLWQRQFNGDSSAIGRKVLLDGEPYELIGVMPPSFAFAPFWATKAELWAPLPLVARATQRGGQSLRIFARLFPTVSLSHAREDITTIVKRIQKDFPGSSIDAQVISLSERVVGSVRTPLLLLLGAVGFVLLIACANVAHMLLARAAARQREMAVRSALGAGRGRLVRQVLTESVLLASMGGVLGIALAAVGVRLVGILGAASIPRVQDVSLDGFALASAILITITSGVVFGLAPAIHSASSDLSAALRSGGRGSTGSSWEGVRRVLIGSQFAFAVMLLVGAGLMIRSVIALQSLDSGLNPHGVVSAVMTVAGSAESPAGRRTAFYQNVVNSLQSLPNIESASAINHAPLTGDLWGFSFRIEGQPIPERGKNRPSAAYRVVLPNYFRTMGIRLIHGRDFTAADRDGAAGVVIVNERMAALNWPVGDAIGRRLSLGSDDKPEWLTVVGISANTVREEWTAPPEAEVFIPLLQDKDFSENPGSHFASFTLVIRAKCAPNISCDANAIVPTVRRVVSTVDATIPLSDVISLDDAIANATAEPRFYLTMLVAFAVVALILAAVGIYGVMSYAVAQRTREMGVRLALGAAPSAVLVQVIREGMLLAMSGGAIGVIGALLLSRFMTSILFGVKPTDPLTFVVVLSVLFLSSLLAVFIPARRATSINPLLALRAD